jgi:F420-non-reducing hydrogenase iron-sulfur subunit
VVTITGNSNRSKQTRRAASVVLIICVNCLRESDERGPLPAGERPAARLDWPIEAEDILLPCTGKIQPEHLLKAFEAGADLVCVVGCEQDNCHCLEGSRRAAQRVHYVRELLDEAGLGGQRLLMFHLPGTAREDMGAAFSAQSGTGRGEATRARISSLLGGIRDEITARLASLGPSPLRGDSAARPASSMEAE